MKNLFYILLSLCILTIGYNRITKKKEKERKIAEPKINPPQQSKSKIDSQKKKKVIQDIEKSSAVRKSLVEKQQILRKVDWKNYDFGNSFMHLKEGYGEGKEYGDPEMHIGTTFFTYKLQEVIYADLTGNDIEEAIIIISGGGGGGEIYHQNSNSNDNELNTLNFEAKTFSSIETLDLSKNQLKEIPTGISNLSKIIDLNVSHNKISIVSPTLKNLTRLRVLDLRGNLLSKTTQSTVKSWFSNCNIFF